MKATRSRNGGALTKQVQIPAWFLLVLILVFGLSQHIATLGVISRNIGFRTQNTSGGIRGALGDLNQQNAFGPLSDITNVPLPVHNDGTPLTIEERLRCLELKTNAHFNFGSNPFFGSQTSSWRCR